MRLLRIPLYALILLLIFALNIGLAVAQDSSARIYYSDLQSGPKTGGQSDKGAFVTVYGRGFGSSRGSSYITIGGGPADNYPVWTDTKITFQLGAAARSGNIIVVVDGVASDAVPFTVRSGEIYFVSNTGNDANSGKAGSTWKTLARAASAMLPGDISYVMDGMVQSSADDNGAALTLTSGGSSGSPKALVAYPGAKVQIGSATGPGYGVYSRSASEWVLAGIRLQGKNEAVHLQSSYNWRMAANDVSCPNATGKGGCINARWAGGLKLLGNRVHDVGSTATGVDKQAYSAVRVGDSRSVEIGFNEVANVRSCRGVDLDAPSGSVYKISFHHNYVHDAPCDALALGDVDTSRGPVSIWNNVIARAGSTQISGSAATTHSCIRLQGRGRWRVRVDNNTLYDCGRYVNGDSGALASDVRVAFRNNVVSQFSGEWYVAPSSTTWQIYGSNNVFYGAGGAPSMFKASIQTNPKLVDPANSNFELASTSPAIDAGLNTGVGDDYRRQSRPQGRAYDIGAFERGGQAPAGTFSLQASPASLSFGSVAVGATASQAVTLKNAGTTSGTISQVTCSNRAYTASGLALPTTLAAGQAVTLTLTFKPAVSGTATGTVTVADSSGTSATVALSGSGVSTAKGQLSANPSSVAFGSVTVGTRVTKPVTLTNTGTVTVSITQLVVNGTAMSMQSGPTLSLTLAAGASTTFTVAFTPTTTASASGSVSVTSNASNSTLTVGLSGTGASAAKGQLSPNPTSVAFGSVTVGTKLTKTVVLTNTGTATTSITQLVVNGAAMSMQSGPALPLTLAVGASTSFTVVFSPTTATAVTGTVSVVSNASNAALTVPLTGTGIAVPTVSHSVTLSWTASSGVTGYHIYRSTISGTGYAKLNSSPSSAATYTDNNVVAGQTYYYTVTSVNSSGVQSSYSSEAKAVIPTP